MISVKGGGAKPYLKPLSHGHYGRFFVSGHRYRHIFEYFRVTEALQNQKSKSTKDNVGWGCHTNKTNVEPKVQPTKNLYEMHRKKSINNSICHPELVSGSVRRHEYIDSSINKSNVGVETPTYFNFNTISYASRNAMWHVRGNLFPKSAFTLADVLITLGIIGVVASLTLPGLIARYEKIVIETKLKTAYSLIVNAFKMAEAEYGIGFDFLENTWKNDDTPNGYNFEFSEAVFETYLKPHFKITKSYNKTDSVNKFTYNNGTTINGSPKCYKLANGMAICFIASGNIDSTAYFYIFLKPNNKNKIAGRDVFNFTVRKKNKNSYFGYQMMSEVYKENNRQQFIDGCVSPERYPITIYDKPFICTTLIWLNNFRIPDDYPIKF